MIVPDGENFLIAPGYGFDDYSKSLKSLTADELLAFLRKPPEPRKATPKPRGKNFSLDDLGDL